MTTPNMQDAPALAWADGTGTVTPDRPSTQFTLAALPFRRALATALAFADDVAIHEGGHPMLAGVHFAAAGDYVAVSATDRYVVSHELVKAEGEVFEFTLPGGVARGVAGLIPAPGEDDDYPARPAGLVTFVRGDGGALSVRIVGHDSTATIAFRDVGGNYPDVLAVLEKLQAEQQAPAGTHLDPEKLARVTRALADRDVTPVKITAGSGGDSLLFRQGDGFWAAIMGIKQRRTPA